MLNSPRDLHVLGTPPAFILSQDQTLRKNLSPYSGVSYIFTVGIQTIGLSSYHSSVVKVLSQEAGSVHPPAPPVKVFRQALFQASGKNYRRLPLSSYCVIFACSPVRIGLSLRLPCGLGLKDFPLLSIYFLNGSFAALGLSFYHVPPACQGVPKILGPDLSYFFRPASTLQRSSLRPLFFAIQLSLICFYERDRSG